MRKENPDQEDARRFDVEIFIVHPTVDPEEIGRALGLEARFLQRAGEERTTPAGRPLSGVYPDTRWRHSARHTVTEKLFASTISAFVERLAPHKDYFVGLRETGGSATVIIQFLGDGYFADSIPPIVLHKLADLGLALGIECFVDRQA
jgi:hypothetical protein